MGYKNVKPNFEEFLLFHIQNTFLRKLNDFAFTGRNCEWWVTAVYPIHQVPFYYFFNPIPRMGMEWNDVVCEMVEWRERTALLYGQNFVQKKDVCFCAIKSWSKMMNKIRGITKIAFIPPPSPLPRSRCLLIPSSPCSSANSNPIQCNSINCVMTTIHATTTSMQWRSLSERDNYTLSGCVKVLKK